jgi:hypothetical protein
MIEIKDGRTRSKRTKNEEIKLLSKELSQLTSDERETLELMLAELREEQEQEEQEQNEDLVEQVKPRRGGLFRQIASLEYKQTPVDMETFIYDKYFLGNTCDNTYPKLAKALTELFEGGYQECVLTGCIGYGKTFTASIGICRILYELSCMRDPHKSFGLAVGSNISILGLSVTEVQATKIVFENIATKINASTYFRENFPFEKTKKELRFPNGVFVASKATTDTSALGFNVISAIMDETDFMPKVAGAKANDPRFIGMDKADFIYNNLKRRMKSRFEKFGRLPGVLFVVSSKNTADAFTARRINEAKMEPDIFCLDYALWEIKPESYYQTAKFQVLAGNEQIASRILQPGEAEKIKATLPESCVIIDVPENFRSDFESDLEKSIRDLAGIATLAISPFIQRRDKIEDAIDRTRVHPFSTPVYDATRGGMFRWDLMVQPTKTRQYGERVEKILPILNPNTPRHIHVDPSIRNDCLGFCMAHIHGWKDVIRRNPDTQEQYKERAPIYVVDFILKVVPPTGGEIILGDIRRIIYELTAHGYIITTVSMDQFNSADGLQQLSQKGYNAIQTSVDTTPDPYDNLKIAMYEDRLFFYDYPPLTDELRKLEQKWDAKKKRKIDHPPRGSKDCADALAGCLYTLSQNSPSAQPLAPMRASSRISPSEDVWLEEQRQAEAAGDRSAARSISMEDYPGLLPAFLPMSSDRDPWGDDGSNNGGGGWPL